MTRTRTAAPPRSVKAPDVRRAEILDCARRQFHEFGIRATTFGNIAHELGITRGLIYHYFGDKDQLVDEVLNGQIDEFVAAVRAWDAARVPGDIEGALSSCVAMFRGQVYATRALHETLEQADSVILYHRFLDQAVAAVVDCLHETTIPAYAARHQIAIEHVRETIQLTIYGLIELTRSRPDVEDELLVDLVRQTLRLPEAGGSSA